MYLQIGFGLLSVGIFGFMF